ncbi:MAG TPA: flagellar filament capping protein FliD [Bryobacteraceae bacterium]|nr:flagellar filament capping protein FliD [Bryobacteraceae bacterium]
MSTSTSGASSNTITFTGTSRYSQDFQNLINRDVAIASLPITQLDQDVTQLTSEGTALSDLDTKFSTLSDAVNGLVTAMGSGSFNADVQDSTIASATVSDGAMEGNYAIEVDDLGAYTTNQSLATGNLAVTDPSSTSISAASSYTLTVGSKNYSITPDGNSLYSLADAINSSSAGVQASIVNQGSTSTPDYRLSLQSSTLGSDTIDLTANTTNSSGHVTNTELMGQPVLGSLAYYKPNGSGVQQSSDSRTVTLAPGLDVTMLKNSPAGQSTSITLTRQSETIGTALQTFVNAYQAAQDDLNQQRGTSGGALSGQPIVYELQDALNQISGYGQPGSSIASLSDIGVTFDKTTFKMTFDEPTFLSATLGSMSGISAFLGDGTTAGFLKNATDAMTSVEDPTQGTLKTAITDNQSHVANDNDRISTETDQVDKLQTNLMNQMDAADAMISSMEQQYTVVSNLFSAMDSSSGTASSSATNSLA